MTEPFIGELRAFAFDFVPRGWLRCEGQLLPIQQNISLFSLIGTLYGGDGRITFGLPDLRGRAPLGIGQGPDLSAYETGQAGGAESVALTVEQLPAHRHSVAADSNATSQRPVGHFPATTLHRGSYGDSPDAQMDAEMLGETGGGQAHENRSPYLAVNWCIALSGVFPSRA